MQHTAQKHRSLLAGDRLGWRTRAEAVALPPLMLAVGLVYLWGYATLPATPGNQPAYPLGWWGWWDQSWYIRSAIALHNFDLRASEHWYPFGYGLLGALFVTDSPGHTYLLADLFCLMAAMGGYVFCCMRLGIGRIAAAFMFILASCGSIIIRVTWVEPWNTTFSAALIWVLFALYAFYETTPAPRGGVGRWAPLLSGMLFPLIFVTRLTDAPVIGAVFLGYVLRPGTPWLARVRTGAASALGAAITGLPLGVLWLAIYGLNKPAYMTSTMQLGFDFVELPWRAYLLLISPDGWFVDGAGLFARYPWLLPGVAGILCAPFITRGAERRVLVVMSAALCLYGVLLCSYVDLAPSGLWHFHNVHYFKWTLPALVLLGYKLVERFRVHWRAALAACAVVLLLTCLRVVPKPAKAGQPAWMVTLAGPVATRSPADFNEYRLTDAAGPQMNLKDIRVVPADEGWRFIAMHRPIAGALTVSGPAVTHGPFGTWPEGKPGVRRSVGKLVVKAPCFW